MTRKRSITPYTFLLPALVLLGHLRRLPDHRGRLLQLHRLRHRHPAGLGRPRQLRQAARRRDVPAGSRPLVRVPARDADPDLPVDRAGHRRQPPDARHPHLPGALLRARGQRQHRHRPRRGAGCSTGTDSSTASSSRGASSRPPSNGSARRPRPADRDAADDLGGRRLLLGHLPGRASEHPRRALRRREHRWLQRLPEASTRQPARSPTADRVRGGHLEPRRSQGLRRDLRPDEPDRRDPRQRRDDGLLPVAAGVPAATTRGTHRRSRSRCSL